MNIVVGASGQVGSIIISEIKKQGFPVRAVVRDPGKLKDSSIESRTADLFHADQLTEAFEGGTAVFVLTPENFASTDIIGDTERVVENYRKAIKNSGIERIIVLSCVGAHVEGNTGNILMSRILEQGINDLNAEKLFIRPSYYFSNWLGYLESVQQFNILPTFFPENFKLEMHSPIDLAKFIAQVMTGNSNSQKENITELAGPQKYSALDVASHLSNLLKKDIKTQTIPKSKWEEVLLSLGFTENTAANLGEMTQALIDNKAVPERSKDILRLSTTLDTYLDEQSKNNQRK